MEKTKGGKRKNKQSFFFFRKFFPQFFLERLLLYCAFFYVVREFLLSVSPAPLSCLTTKNILRKNFCKVVSVHIMLVPIIVHYQVFSNFFFTCKKKTEGKLFSFQTCRKMQENAGNVFPLPSPRLHCKLQQ